jgi:hypothetical protein
MSEKVYLIADTHFGDAGILRYKNRPFPDVDEMDTALIYNWNTQNPPDSFAHGLLAVFPSSYVKFTIKNVNFHFFKKIMFKYDIINLSDETAISLTHFTIK